MSSEDLDAIFQPSDNLPEDTFNFPPPPTPFIGELGRNHLGYLNHLVYQVPGGGEPRYYVFSRNTRRDVAQQAAQVTQTYTCSKCGAVIEVESSYYFSTNPENVHRDNCASLDKAEKLNLVDKNDFRTAIKSGGRIRARNSAHLLQMYAAALGPVMANLTNDQVNNLEKNLWQLYRRHNPVYVENDNVPAHADNNGVDNNQLEAMEDAMNNERDGIADGGIGDFAQEAERGFVERDVLAENAQAALVEEAMDISFGRDAFVEARVGVPVEEADEISAAYVRQLNEIDAELGHDNVAAMNLDRQSMARSASPQPPSTNDEFGNDDMEIDDHPLAAAPLQQQQPQQSRSEIDASMANYEAMIRIHHFGTVYHPDAHQSRTVYHSDANVIHVDPQVSSAALNQQQQQQQNNINNNNHQRANVVGHTTGPFGPTIPLDVTVRPFGFRNEVSRDLHFVENDAEADATVARVNRDGWANISTAPLIIQHNRARIGNSASSSSSTASIAVTTNQLPPAPMPQQRPQLARMPPSRHARMPTPPVPLTSTIRMPHPQPAPLPQQQPPPEDDEDIDFWDLI